MLSFYGSFVSILSEARGKRQEATGAYFLILILLLLTHTQKKTLFFEYEYEYEYEYETNEE